MSCEHPRRNIVWSHVNTSGDPFESGRLELRHQCADCGRLLAQQLPHRHATPSTPAVDLAALKKWVDADRQYWRDHWRDRARFYEERREEEPREWFKEHEEYLRTPAWRAKRNAVIARERGLCQGCRLRPAVHVHHVTYANWKNELLWELVAVCLDCHERAHKRKLSPSYRADDES